MTMENVVDLLMLILLQAVLGFDNLLYISLESKRAPLDKQKSVRIWGIGLAVVLRIVLLFVLLKMMDSFQSTWFKIDTAFVHAEVNFTSLITLLGGVFIIYTAVKEIIHMLSYEEAHAHDQEKKRASVGKIVALIVLMNLVFSFDSILSAMAITKVAWVMTIAIVISGILMIVMADKVSSLPAEKPSLRGARPLHPLYRRHLTHLRRWSQSTSQFLWSSRGSDEQDDLLLRHRGISAH